jgi:hypothetical protein
MNDLRTTNVKDYAIRLNEGGRVRKNRRQCGKIGRNLGDIFWCWAQYF